MTFNRLVNNHINIYNLGKYLRVFDCLLFLYSGEAGAILMQIGKEVADTLDEKTFAPFWLGVKMVLKYIN